MERVVKELGLRGKVEVLVSFFPGLLFLADIPTIFLLVRFWWELPLSEWFSWAHFGNVLMVPGMEICSEGRGVVRCVLHVVLSGDKLWHRGNLVVLVLMWSGLVQ